MATGARSSFSHPPVVDEAAVDHRPAALESRIELTVT